MELDDSIYQMVIEYCNKGEELFDEGELQNAFKEYMNALELLPAPKEEWEAAEWIYSALGDVCAELGDNEKSLNYFLLAEKCPDGLVNPYIQLQIGIAFFNCNNLKNARDYLLRAYMLEGEDIFDGEDPKYFLAIKDLI